VLIWSRIVIPELSLRTACLTDNSLAMPSEDSRTVQRITALRPCPCFPGPHLVVAFQDQHGRIDLSTRHDCPLMTSLERYPDSFFQDSF
jgi:hypothetical protein